MLSPLPVCRDLPFTGRSPIGSGQRGSRCVKASNAAYRPGVPRGEPSPLMFALGRAAASRGAGRNTDRTRGRRREGCRPGGVRAATGAPERRGHRALPTCGPTGTTGRSPSGPSVVQCGEAGMPSATEFPPPTSCPVQRHPWDVRRPAPRWNWQWVAGVSRGAGSCRTRRGCDRRRPGCGSATRTRGTARPGACRRRTRAR